MKALWATAVLASTLIAVACKSAPPRQAEAVTSPPTAVAGYPNLAVQAAQLVDALSRKDYGKFLDLTYPKAIEVGGGREKMLAEMTKEVQSMETEGVTMISSTCAAPTQFVSDASGLYAVVPTMSKVKAKDGTFQLEGCLIGVSTDGGQNWTFVDATGKDQIELKKVLPNLERFNLPAEKPPVKLTS